MTLRTKLTALILASVFALGTRPISAFSAELQHVVTSEAPTLFEIGILLYGRGDRWKEIADLNRIVDPKGIHEGQTLKLARPPQLTPEQGKLVLLNYWRAHFGLTPVTEVPQKKIAAKPTEAPALDLSEVRVESPTRVTLAVPKPDAFPPSFDPPQIPQTLASIPTSTELQNPVIRQVVIEKARTAEETKALSAKELFESGRIQEAREEFHRQRSQHPEVLSHWFFELRCLKLLNRETELRETLSEFESRFPHLSQLPAIVNYRKAGAS